LKLFRKISALFLAMLVLLGSTSFTFNMHKCMGQIRSMALFMEATPCDMESMNDGAHESHTTSDAGIKVSKQGCCEEHSLFVEGQDELKITSSVNAPDVQFLAVLFTITLFSPFQVTPSQDTFREYAPPLIERDIPVLCQTFLI